MDDTPNELERATNKMRSARGRQATALAHKKLDPNNPAAAERLQDAVGASREAWGDYKEAADAALAPVRADIDAIGEGRLKKGGDGAAPVGSAETTDQKPPVKLVMLVEGGLVDWIAASDTDIDITVIYRDHELTGEVPISGSKETPFPLDDLDEEYVNVVRFTDDPSARTDTTTCLGCAEPLDVPNAGYCGNCLELLGEDESEPSK